MTWTRVLNVTALVVLVLCMFFGVTYTDQHVGGIALLIWSVINLFTEGGVQERKLSRTVIVNGILAGIGLATSLGWASFTDAQAAQVVFLVSAGLNLISEGGIGIGQSNRIRIVPVLACALALSACGTAMNALPEPDAITTARQANTALVKAQAVRVLARDIVAEAHVASPDKVTPAVLATFDKYDTKFTDAYRSARRAVDAGVLETFRALYAVVRTTALDMNRIAAGGVQ